MRPTNWPRDGYRAALWQAALPAAEKIVALTYAEHCVPGSCNDPEGFTVSLTRDEVMAHAGLSEASVKRALRALRDSGWLVMVRPGRQHYAPVYRIAVPLGYELADLPYCRMRQRDHTDPPEDSQRDHTDPSGAQGDHTDPQGGLTDPHQLINSTLSTHLPYVTSPAQEIEKTTNEEFPMEPTPLHGQPNPFGRVDLGEEGQQAVADIRSMLRAKPKPPAPVPPGGKPKVLPEDRSKAEQEAALAEATRNPEEARARALQRAAIERTRRRA